MYPLEKFTAEELFNKIEFLSYDDRDLLGKVIARKRKSKEKTIEAVLSYMNKLSKRRTYSCHGVTNLHIVEAIRL